MLSNCYGLSSLLQFDLMRHAAVGNLLLVLCVGSFCYVTLWLLITVSCAAQRKSCKELF